MSVVTTVSACIQAEKDDVAKVVLMPGDPLRAKFIAETYMTDVVLFNDVRNMYGYTGTYKGKRISVMGSGMGIPSFALYASELYNFFDVETIIRVGSAGALDLDVHTKDLVIAMSASHNSNIADQFSFQGTIAPTATYELLEEAVNVCKEKNIKYKVGPVYSTDLFYNANTETPAKARDLGMYAQEMETAGLYLTAAKEHKKALSLLSISDHMFLKEALSPQEIRETFTDMMEVALETAWLNA